MKRSGPLRRRSPLRADPATTRAWRTRTARPLPARSERGRDRDRAWNAVRAEVLRRDGGCRFPLDGACSGPLDVHHLAPRSVRPDLALDPDNCRVLCRRHHRWVHDHPADAYRLDLLRRSTGQPDPGPLT